ncbi:MAG: hypothetical protein GX442_03275 [Candidatus Riflebacteria bacterium]|nr:hypothetical protein [Candidatus Riflebacteria bacterium]
MRRIPVMVVALVLAASCCTFAFDVSPTTVRSKPVAAPSVKVSSDLLDSLFEDETLASGIELMQVAPDGSRIQSMRGALSTPLSGDLAAAARTFITDHAKVFNLQDTKDVYLLANVRNEEIGGASHVAYQMTIDGVKVHDAVISVHIGKDRRVNLVSGSLPTIREFANQITLGRIQAIAAAKRAVGAKAIVGIPKAELNVLPVAGERGLMVFNVKLSSREPLGDWEVLIDAESGKEVSRLNQMAFATGQGSVYLNHPLAGEPTTVELPHLTAHTLKGLYAVADNEDVPEAVATDDVHIYEPANTHFDEVNIYHYITRVHDFFKSMGFNKLDTPITATVHYGDKYDNAYFSPWSNSMAFGDGNRLNDLAKEESVCFHEYSHAMINQIVRLNYSAESGAMNEGQADYFACTLSNDEKLGEYAVAKMGKPYLRIMTNTLHYPDNIAGEVHADGQIWGAVLWDLRAALGPEISDKLIYNSFYYLKAGSPKFLDGANAIFTADKNLFDGANQAALAKVFNARGITSKSAYNGSVLDAKDIKRIGLFRVVHGE